MEKIFWHRWNEILLLEMKEVYEAQIPKGYELAYLPEYWKVKRDGSLETQQSYIYNIPKKENIMLQKCNENLTNKK